MKDFSYITSAHPAYIESLYADFLKNQDSVDPDLKKFFEGFDFAMSFAPNSSSIANPPSINLTGPSN